MVLASPHHPVKLPKLQLLRTKMHDVEAFLNCLGKLWEVRPAELDWLGLDGGDLKWIRHPGSFRDENPMFIPMGGRCPWSNDAVPRWVPTSYRWFVVNPFLWRFRCVTGVFSLPPKGGVITPPYNW